MQRKKNLKASGTVARAMRRRNARSAHYALTGMRPEFILVEKKDIRPVTLIRRLFKNAQMQGARGHDL